MEGDIKEVFQGLKVVEWSHAITGPFVGKLFADFGAEVVKVETTKRNMDITRLSVPYAGGIPHPDRSPTFLRFNTSKKSVTLDLKKPEGLALFKKLLEWADVYLNNQRPGAMKRLGLGYEDVKKINKEIIMVDISNFGQEGPYASAGGWGTLPMAASGQFHFNRNKDGLPMVTGWTNTADVVGPIAAQIAIISALDYRKRSGKGQYIDVSQLDIMTQLFGVSLLDYNINKRIQEAVGNKDPQAAPHGVYRCKGEDQWCAIAIYSDEEWKDFCTLMGNPEWARTKKFKNLLLRKEHEDELDQLITNWTINRSRYEVMDLMQKANLAAGAVQDISDILEGDPQVRHRRLYPKIKHPVMGKCFHSGWPFILSETPVQIRTSPCLGEHNEYVFINLLGLSDADFLDGIKSEAIS